jgi:prepilin-type N-terminal cleavage/methylation domain-containing protein
MRRSGFTLIELLVVIGIIMLLMGLLFPVFGMIRRQAQKTKCRTLIHQVDAACDQYRQLNGAYPDTPVGRTSTPTMKDIFLTGGTMKSAPTVTEPQWADVADMLRLALETTNRELFRKATALNDPWGQPLHYRPVQFYPYTAGAWVTPMIDGDPPPRPDTYQLWSCGLDEKDGYAEDASDDIPNWK